MAQTILLVDDDVCLLQGLMSHWHVATLHARTARSAAEALSVMEQCPVDAIVCNWRMPGVADTDFLAQIAADYPRTVRILLAAKAHAEAARSALDNGTVHKCFTKPCDAGHLAGALKRTLAAKGKTHALAP